MKPGTVGVAMATYNGAKYLPAQLQSLVMQSHPPELLVVADDGSTDATLELLAVFKAQAPFEVIILTSSGGLGPTRNFSRAMERCDAEFVFLCDQDDGWHPYRFERTLREFDEGVSLVLCDAALVDSALVALGETLWGRLGFDASEFNVIDDLAHRTIAFGLTMAYRNTAEFKRRAFPLPMPCGHDNFSALVLAALGEVRCVNLPLLKYRQHGGQVSGTRGKRTLMQRSITPDASTFRCLAERLHDVSSPVAKSIVAYAVRKAEHLDKRNRASRETVGLRIASVVQMMLRGEYGLYSNGVRSAVKDVIGDR